MILNSGYEEAESIDRPGQAAHWETTTVATLEQTAEFKGDSSLAISGHEGFELGWAGYVDLGEGEYVFNSQALIVDLIDADVEKLVPESFEYTWALDQGFYLLTTLEAATFDTHSQAVEDYENGWGSPLDADNVLSPSEIEAAVFDAEDSEDFEDGWGSTAFTMGSVTAVVFDNGGLSSSTASPLSAETFAFKARQHIRSNTAANTVYAVDPPLSVVTGDAVTFVAEEGALPTPLSENTTYIVQTVVSDTCTLAPHPGATIIDLTLDGLGANYLIPDPGRFWSEEL